MKQIYKITPELLEDEDLFDQYVCKNLDNTHFWSDDWSEEFYISLAQAGFIATSHHSTEGQILLPELQSDYAVLDFEDLYVSKKVRKLLAKENYELCFNIRFDELLEKFQLHHKDNWLKGRYAKLLKALYLKNWIHVDFEILSVALLCKDTNTMVAGEVGYIIGKTYTSLSGFSSREKKYANYGNLQLVLLAQYLQERGFAFWNLGHPYMEYKTKLGCKVYERREFLKRWREARGL